jgi:hypothetical protein
MTIIGRSRSSISISISSNSTSNSSSNSSNSSCSIFNIVYDCYYSSCNSNQGCNASSLVLTMRVIVIVLYNII